MHTGHHQNVYLIILGEKHMAVIVIVIVMVITIIKFITEE